ncbi:MAG: asparagine synthase (glutamine-hydrolyzing) [Candidatus Sumerlaeota bacterium]|nr:asparagine synthase (glutamine-hydrolyzing) [Candidatus Sumerlaeota bacterium]
MCGICGIIESNGRPVDAEALARMNAAMAHRGPDDVGQWNEGSAGLAHCRLAIIDLSPLGHQPFFSDDESLAVIFNGEIYNFPELRAEYESRGCRFRSHSDTEVLIHGYALDGDDFVRRLNGMFAFALWDRRRRRLLLARDRPGMKPLYYHANNGRFVFASEMRALVQNRAIPRELDTAALYHYLNLTYIPPPYTIFKSVRKFPAGCVGVFENGQLRVKPYFEFQFKTDERPRPEAEWREELLATFRRAVNRHLISDVPLGAFLSGGIDSSAVVAAMAHARGPGGVKTFSITNRNAEYDESAYARAMARHAQTDHTEFEIDIGGFDPAHVERIVRHFGEPFADSSAIPTFEVSRLARPHVTVALTGDGGDEIFAGYDRYSWLRKIERLRRIPRSLRASLMQPALAAARALPGLRSLGTLRQAYRGNRLSLEPADRIVWGMYSLFFPPERDLPLAAETLASVSEYDRAGYFDSLLAQMPAHSTILQKALYFDFKVGLEGEMLTKVDRMSMAVALETRCPFLDAEMLELAMRVPDDLKLHGHEKKYIVKRTMAPEFPPEVIGHRKWGFAIPLHTYLDDRFLAMARDLLSPEKIKSQGLFDPARVARTLDAFAAWRQTPSAELSLYQVSARLWSLVIFQAWAKEYGCE